VVKRLVVTTTLAVSYVLGSAGCDGCRNPRPSTERPIMNPLLRFDAKFRVSDKELVLTYEVENRSTRDMYMLDRIDRDNDYRADPNVVYVHLERDTKTVWLNKQIPRVPKGVRPYAPSVPYSTPLRAGATVREEIHVPLPVREVRAYEGRRPEGELRPVQYRQAYFTLQYYWRIEGMTEEILNIRGGHKVIATRSGTRRLQQSDYGLLETERVAIDLPVLE
jgi:hypothetical protein